MSHKDRKNNALVQTLYPKFITNAFGDDKTILNEQCSCGRLITEHAGSNGHGASLDGECSKFTWTKWVLLEDIQENNDA
jgi:hypothetical protein